MDPISELKDVHAELGLAAKAAVGTPKQADNLLGLQERLGAVLKMAEEPTEEERAARYKEREARIENVLAEELVALRKEREKKNALVELPGEKEAEHALDEAGKTGV